MVRLAGLSFVALMISATADAQRPSDSPPNIIVTGDRIQDYRDRLAECLARSCPTDEDIDASTALAELLMLKGQYGEARNVLRAAIGRNRREASGYPEPVSELFRAHARVARHLGWDDEAKRSQRQILRSLKTGIPTEDHRHFTARLELANSYFSFGQFDRARHELKELAELASQAGRDDVAATAELWSLWIDYAEFPPGGALNRIQEVAQSSDPRRSIGAKKLLIRIYSHRKETDKADALLAELGRTGQRRQLLYSPIVKLLQQEHAFAAQARLAAVRDGRGATANLIDRLTDTFDDKWVDVAFQIRADGSVDDIQILRRGSGSGGWEKPLIESIKGRRYSASDKGQETLRIERYTYISELRRNGTGSRISDRSPRARVERLELSSVDIPN